MAEKVGIIAGEGKFPLIVANEIKARGDLPIICGFNGHTADLSACTTDFKLVHLGQISKVIDFFKEHKLSRLCFAGAINKPKALELRPDFLAAKILFSLKTKGDDTLLRAIIREFEKENFSVVSAADLAPSLRCPDGLLTSAKPNSDFLADTEFGFTMAKELGRHDIGQCIVVKRGMVVAVECLEGTDATLFRAAELGKKDCVAIKIAKPGQDERIDLPSIGLQTIEFLIKNNYLGLAVQAHKTLFFDRIEAIKLANKHKLTILAKSQL